MSGHMLTLMRHAKSSWKSPGLSDHDRALNLRGERDAPEMASRLLRRGTIPDLILSSSAVRAVATARHLLAQFKTELPDNEVPAMCIEPELYLASSERLLAAVCSTDPGIRHLLVVAHNPGLEELSALLGGDTEPQHFPTAALRQFQMPVWDQTDSELIIGKFPGTSTPATTAECSERHVRLIYSDFPKNTDH